MTAIPVAASEGHDIHIAPHDIHYSNGETLHLDTAPADVHVDAVVDHGTVVVVMGRVGTARWAVVYDRTDLVEEAQVAA